MTNPSPATKLCGLIGHPVNNSLSPAMHNAAFEALGLDAVYFAFRVAPTELRQAVEGARAMDMFGLNVTIPHKITVIPLLDALSPHARAIGAVNTVVNRNGKLIGYNTDGDGAMDVLKETKFPNADDKVAIIGAGGTARAIAYHLARAGAALTILNRTVGRARILAKKLRRPRSHMVFPLTRRSLASVVPEATLVVNATPIHEEWFGLGAFHDGPLFRRGQVFLDACYGTSPTALSLSAERSGARVISGIELLLAQGARSFRIWTGKDPPIRVMKHAILAELGKRGR